MEIELYIIKYYIHILLKLSYVHLKAVTLILTLLFLSINLSNFTTKKKGF